MVWYACENERANAVTSDACTCACACGYVAYGHQERRKSRKKRRKTIREIETVRSDADNCQLISLDNETSLEPPSQIDSSRSSSSSLLDSGDDDRSRSTSDAKR